MKDASRVSTNSVPTPYETAVIMAALEVLRGEEPESATLPECSRWRLAGLLGHPPPPDVDLEGSLWSYSSWKGGV